MQPSSPIRQELVPAIQTNERHDAEQTVDRPILEVMEEMRTQLRMIDGETKAFYENSYRYLRESKNEVHKLRENNRNLRKKIAEHESVTDMVLDCISTEEWNKRLSNRTDLLASHVLELFDEEVAKKMNQLNMLRYQTRLKETRNGDLTTELNMLRLQSEQIHHTQLGHGPIMQAIRSVENKIEKVTLKHSEMLHIGRTYVTIRDKLQEESFTYVTTADAMKTEIERCSRKLAELRPTYQDAELIRDKAKTELQRHEELLYAHRKRNELEISSLRRFVEVKKDKLVPQKNPMMEQELRKLDVEGLGDEIEEESTSEPQTRLNFCNKLFESMKQVTGLSELPQIVKRFEDQQETSTQLGLLRAHNDNELKRLKNQSTELKQHLATIRTAYEERKERQKSLEADRQKLLVEQQRKLKELKDTVDVVEKQLTRVHLVIEHLYTKLCLVRMATKRDRTYSTVRAKELLLDLTTEDLLERCLELQQQLQTDLEDYDMFDEEEKLDEAMSESLRTRDEYQVTVERRVPINAARIEIPNKDIAFADEPGEGDQDVLTREALKQRSRMIVEHAKRKVTRNSRNRRQANPLN